MSNILDLVSVSRLGVLPPFSRNFLDGQLFWPSLNFELKLATELLRFSLLNFFLALRIQLINWLRNVNLLRVHLLIDDFALLSSNASQHFSIRCVRGLGSCHGPLSLSYLVGSLLNSHLGVVVIELWVVVLGLVLSLRISLVLILSLWAELRWERTEGSMRGPRRNRLLREYLLYFASPRCLWPRGTASRSGWIVNLDFVSSEFDRGWNSFRDSIDKVIITLH